jgi:uncharacterized protein
MDNIKAVGIISDSHDNMITLQKAVDLFKQRNVDMVIHAGDLVAPFTAKILKQLECPLVIVFGNNDGELFGLKNVFEGQIFQPPHQFRVNGKKVLLLHDPILLNELQYSDLFDVIIYGHLHRVDIRNGKPLIINPGESCGWLYGKATVAIWNAETDDVEVIELK